MLTCRNYTHKHNIFNKPFQIKPNKNKLKLGTAAFKMEFFMTIVNDSRF